MIRSILVVCHNHNSIRMEVAIIYDFVSKVIHYQHVIMSTDKERFKECYVLMCLTQYWVESPFSGFVSYPYKKCPLRTCERYSSSWGHASQSEEYILLLFSKEKSLWAIETRVIACLTRRVDTIHVEGVKRNVMVVPWLCRSHLYIQIKRCMYAMLSYHQTRGESGCCAYTKESWQKLNEQKRLYLSRYGCNALYFHDRSRRRQQIRECVCVLL